MMFSFSNGLSLLRAPLALLFLSQSMLVRLIAIVLAMVSDACDGFLARKTGSATKLGAILDPAMDKFFVAFALAILFFEGSLPLWQVCAMISRDLFLCIFAVYLKWSKKWQACRFRAIRWGKATTALQFLTLIGITLHLTISPYFYGLFILFGLFAFIELFQLIKERSISSS